MMDLKKETVVPLIVGRYRPTMTDGTMDRMLTLEDQVLIDVFFTPELSQ